LAEGFVKDAEANPTLLTGGRGLGDLVPDYVKIFRQAFLKEGFVKLPN
jgi:hypothetical protein